MTRTRSNRCCSRSSATSSARMFCSSGWRSPCSPAVTCSLRASRAGQDARGQVAGRRDRRAVPADPIHPDLVPADLVGTRVYLQRTGEFEVSLGPVFTNLLLADEINRAPAKVQSALLEVMQERQVTIGRETFPVRAVPGDGNPEPDRVRRHLPAARGTGRSIHDEGPCRLSDPAGGACGRRAGSGAPGPPQVMLTPEDLIRMRESVSQVYVDPAVVEYAVRLVAATRSPGGSAKATWRGT